MTCPCSCGVLSSLVWRAQALIVFSRVGVYMRLPGVDAERFAETVQSGGILGYIDALSGGSISRVGIFSLGVVLLHWRPAAGRPPAVNCGPDPLARLCRDRNCSARVLATLAGVHASQRQSCRVWVA